MSHLWLALAAVQHFIKSVEHIAPLPVEHSSAAVASVGDSLPSFLQVSFGPVGSLTTFMLWETFVAFRSDFNLHFFFRWKTSWSGSNRPDLAKSIFHMWQIIDFFMFHVFVEEFCQRKSNKTNYWLEVQICFHIKNFVASSTKDHNCHCMRKVWIHTNQIFTFQTSQNRACRSRSWLAFTAKVHLPNSQRRCKPIKAAAAVAHVRQQRKSKTTRGL